MRCKTQPGSSVVPGFFMLELPSGIGQVCGDEVILEIVTA
jgi:hypothetical protein